MFNWFKKLFNKRESEQTTKSNSFKLTNELNNLAQEYKNECEYLKESK